MKLTRNMETPSARNFWANVDKAKAQTALMTLDKSDLLAQLDEAKLHIRNLLLMQPTTGRADRITREEAREFIGEES